MASLSQALRLGDLPPPHRTFQGHATHIIEWSMMLRPNDSWSTCILQGIATFLHYASRRSAGYRYTTPRWVAIEWIGNKDAGANQTYSSQPDQRGSPKRAGRPKGASQSNRESEDEQACNDKSSNLHPTGVADGEGADGVAQGIIVDARGALHDPRDTEQRTGD